MAFACSTSGRARAGLAVAALFACACADEGILLTIEGRDTVRPVARLAVEIEDATGALEGADFDVADGALGKSLTIATTGRDGLVTIRVQAFDEAELLAGLGEISVPVGGTFGASLVLDPAEFGLNERVVGDQIVGADGLSGAQLAVAADRTALAVWQGERVYARLFDPRARPAINATELTPLEFPVSTDEPDSGGEHNPSVAHSADRWAVTWERRGSSGLREIVARTFELADAAPTSFTDHVVAATATVHNRAPDIFALTDGRFGVAWQRELEDDFSQTQVYVRLLDEDGSPITNDVLVSTGESLRQEDNDAFGLASGGFGVVWSEGFDRIVARLFDAAGTPVGGDVILAPAGNGEFNRHSRAIGRPGQGFAVAYVHAGAEGSFVALGLFDDAGTPVQPALRVADLGNFAGIDVAARGADGAIAVVWADGNGSDSDFDIYLRVYSASGAPCTEPMRVNTHVIGNQRGPSVAAFGADAFALAWTDDSTTLHDPDMAAAVGRIVYPVCD